MQVLIVEDDRFLANAYKIKFTKAGYDVVIASNGKECLDILAKDKPSVMLLDLMMPTMDGFSVLEQMKTDPALSSIPVLVASNLGQKEDIEKALALGAKDFFIKSDTPLEEIARKVVAILEPSKSE